MNKLINGIGMLVLVSGLLFGWRTVMAAVTECGLINGVVVPCYCGDTIIGDYTLTENLRGRSGETACPADGLALGLRQPGKDAPTLDCANFEIAGNNKTGRGIVVNDSRAIRLIKNCKVHDFEFGVHHSGGGNGFTLLDSEIYNNRMGVATYASGDILISHNIIRDNSDANIMLDETPRIEISDNLISGSQYGIAPGLQAMWTTDLTAIWPDRQKINRNIIENSSVEGMRIMASHSEYQDNIIRNNKSGFIVNLLRAHYRRWEAGTVVGYGYGAKRTNNNLISGNQIYDNLNEDFNFYWDQTTIGDQPQGFTNNFTNNSVAGKDVAYYADISDKIFSGLDLAAFICTHCSNITVRDSQINEIYLGYTSSSTIENIISITAKNGITLVQSSDNTFRNIRYGAVRSQKIAQDRMSVRNTFSDAGQPMRNINVLLIGVMATRGSISPGTVAVPEGGSQLFTITPKPGYQLATISLDGVAQATTSLPVAKGKISYLLSDVRTQYLLRVTFTPGETVDTPVAPDTPVVPTEPPPRPVGGGGSSRSGGGGGGSGVSNNRSSEVARSTPTAVRAAPIFTAALAPAARGEQVKILQQYLAKDRTIYPEAIVSGYYGPLTSQAIKRFQLKYQITEPVTAGAVGPKTLAKLNEVYAPTATVGSPVLVPTMAPTATSTPALQLLLRLFQARLSAQSAR